MGTVELTCSHQQMIVEFAIDARTGLEMIKMLASGAWSAAALAKSRTMLAFVLNRSEMGVNIESLRRTALLTIARHAGFARHTSRNDDNLGALECLGEAGGRGVISSDLCASADGGSQSEEASYLALGVDVANVGSDT